MRIVFFGTPQFAIPTLEKLLAEPQFQVLGVVTQPDKSRGRGNKLSPSPIKELAVAHHLPIWQPARIKKDPETIEALRQVGADLFVVVAYGQILSQEILDLPKLGCINVHGSLLPAYRGAAPIQRCLTDGVRVTGITTMLMDAGMDTGAMLLKYETPVSLWDNADRLAAKLAIEGANLLVETIYTLDRIVPTPQEHAAATAAPPIQKSEYTIDWTRAHLEIHNRVRGFYPNCVTSFREQPLKILATVPLGIDFQADLPLEMQKLLPEIETLDLSNSGSGTVVKIAKGLGPIVQTGSGCLLLQEVQPPGKRPQSGTDLVNGTRLAIGEILG
ncbi:methionyl-tRNA formyltransferase [Chamaesiphon minutus]|uniref:Methionyl-tRNA formyltransferase n=1 Tax=Chamaesiphon minutus (strain ATCC 27169 / PCC 6605) TaxID=1173020 RepID=K9UMA5_CHAP6|nr:methionyl-tRNA formyltransferase [Chamaesiphon minutus]AFY96247.1 methionyl-tRNA formyltransferase [Chamaesiphon minutus PCC 6605]